jgi:hypothetical protein
MLHMGIALELSKLMEEDRKRTARARRRVRSAETSSGSRMGVDGASDRPFEWRERAETARGRSDGAPTITSDDPWWAWRVVEPDAEYLRRPAA